MLCKSPHHLATSEDILGKPLTGFDPRLQKSNDILLTNYVKSSIIEVTKAKTKNIFIIYNKYILLNYILLLLCSYTH